MFNSKKSFRAIVGQNEEILFTPFGLIQVMRRGSHWALTINDFVAGEYSKKEYAQFVFDKFFQLFTNDSPFNFGLYIESALKVPTEEHVIHLLRMKETLNKDDDESTKEENLFKMNFKETGDKILEDMKRHYEKMNPKEDDDDLYEKFSDFVDSVVPDGEFKDSLKNKDRFLNSDAMKMYRQHAINPMNWHKLTNSLAGGPHLKCDNCERNGTDKCRGTHKLTDKESDDEDVSIKDMLDSIFDQISKRLDEVTDSTSKDEEDTEEVCEKLLTELELEPDTVESIANQAARVVRILNNQEIHAVQEILEDPGILIGIPQFGPKSYEALKILLLQNDIDTNHWGDNWDEFKAKYATSDA